MPQEDEQYFQYYLSIRDKLGFLAYASEQYALSELELINLIKLLIVERRNKTLGEKLLAIYEDSTEQRKELTQKRLSMIGIKNGKSEPTRTGKFRTK